MAWRRCFVTDSIVPPYREGDPSSSLLVRVRAQDKAAWDRLVHLYAPLVYGWCRKAGLQESDALDVGQDVFQTVWCKIHTFRRDRPGDSFLGWLRVLTRRKIVDHLRKWGRNVAPGGSDALACAQEVPGPDLSDTDVETDRAEKGLLYHRAVALIREEFEEKTWRAFEAVVLNSQTPAETAKALSMSVNAVYLARSHVLKRLREEFDGLIET
jgi:RNA polymerase sigma-70 factor (ECF subfamily)